MASSTLMHGVSRRKERESARFPCASLDSNGEDDIGDDMEDYIDVY